METLQLVVDIRQVSQERLRRGGGVLCVRWLEMQNSSGRRAGCFWGGRKPQAASIPENMPRTGPAKPIFIVYDVPALQRPIYRRGMEDNERVYVVAAAAAARGETTGKPPRARSDQLSTLVSLWTQLHQTPRGAHMRLAQAAEHFAHAAMASEDTRWRRHALHSVGRELGRQHAALATRLSRERRACPSTLAARNQVVGVKRLVRAVIRASIDRGSLERDGGSEEGSRGGERGSEGGDITGWASSSIVSSYLTPSHAEHTRINRADDQGDEVGEDPLQCLQQFSYVATKRRDAGNSMGTSSGGESKRAGVAEQSPTASDGLDSLRDFRYVATFRCASSTTPAHPASFLHSVASTVLPPGVPVYTSESPPLPAAAVTAPTAKVGPGACGIRKMQVHKTNRDVVKVSCFFLATRARVPQVRSLVQESKRLRLSPPDIDLQREASVSPSPAKARVLRSRFFENATGGSTGVDISVPE